LDFKIFTAFKPIFAQKSDAAKQRKAVLENKSLSQATNGLAISSETDNYNKYVVIADVAKNNAELEPVASADTSAATFAAVQQAYNSSLSNPIALYQEQKNALLSEDVISFLQSHIAFWDSFFKVSVDMLQDATTLRQKIEDSN